MLTISPNYTKFPPRMKKNLIISILFVLTVFVLQSCYTMVYAPKTLPQSITTVVSEPAMGTSLGGTVVYGWDPYWEPLLPYTNYHRGFGSSYYSPYNYYDYYDAYYTPVYVISEKTPLRSGRAYDREKRQGGDRERETKPSSSSSLNQGTGFTSTAAPAVSTPLRAPSKNPEIKPIVKKAPIVRETKREAKPVVVRETTREVKTVVRERAQTTKKNESEKTKQSSGSSRTRTKK